MKQKLRNLILVGTGCLTSLLVTNSGSWANNNHIAQSTGNPEFFAQYRQECEANAVAGNLSQAQAKQLCSCILNGFQERYSVEEFKAITRQAREEGGDALTALVEVGQSCAQQLNAN